MPVKILLADKSITIQKVVEMLFSGKEYEVTCVSDGETALHEASRIRPDVVLADVDLPRMDGYSFAERCKSIPALATTPIVLMLSRDDPYDAVRGKQAGIADNIAKPFESQDLIGKVKRALTAAPVPRPSVEAGKPAERPVAPVPPKPESPPAAAPAPQKPAVPADIFEVIREAPSRPAAAAAMPAPQAKQAAPFDMPERAREAPAKPAAPVPVTAPQPQREAEQPEEEVFDVEPEFEVEPELEAPAPPPAARPAPTAPPAVPVQREFPAAARAIPEVEGSAEEPETIDSERLFETPAVMETETEAAASLFESDMEIEELAQQQPTSGAAAAAAAALHEPLPEDAEKALPLGAKALEEIREGLGLAEEPFKPSGVQSEIVSFESLDVASRVSDEDYAPRSEVQEIPPQAAPATPPPPPPEPAAAIPPSSAREPRAAVSEELVQAVTREIMEKMAREIIERVAWEVIPDLAERLIREEIERLKAEQ